MTLKPEDIAQLASAIARRNAESDPARLRERIAQLEAELAALRAQQPNPFSRSQRLNNPPTVPPAPAPSGAPQPQKRSHHKKATTP